MTVGITLLFLCCIPSVFTSKAKSANKQQQHCSGIKSFNCVESYVNKTNFTEFGAPLVRIGVMNDSRFPVLLDPSKLDGDQIYPGYAVEITRLICEALKVDCQFIVDSTSESYGILQVDGNWSGMLGKIANGTFDTTLPVITPTQGRKLSFDFASYVVRYPFDFATRKPDFTDFFSMDYMLMPFQPSVWLLLLATVVLLSFVVTVYQDVTDGRPGCSVGVFAVSEVNNLVEVIGGLVTSPSTSRLPRWASRFLLFFWGLALVVLIGSYTGAIFSALLTISPPLPFTDVNSLTECIAEGRCSLVLTEYRSYYETSSGGNEINLTTELSPLYEALRKNSAALLRVKNLSTVLKWVKNPPGQKFYVAKPDLYAYASLTAHDCSVRLVPYTSEGEPNSFVFRRGDHLASQFGQQLKVLVRTGISAKLLNKYGVMVRNCSRVQEGTLGFGSIPFPAIAGALVFLTGGLALATVVLAIEKTVAICKQNSRIEHF